MLINFDHLKTFYNALVQKLKSSRGNWEQNDPSADDYIKNRPFYSEVNTGDLVSNLDSENYINGNYPPCTFIEGHKYDVVWNGTLYTDVICTLDDPYHMLVVDGVFYIDDNGGNGLYIEPEEDEDFVVSITTGPSETVHPIDPKYLPGDLVTRDDLSEVLPDNLVTTDNIDSVIPDVVRYTTQSFSDEEKRQARANIEAVWSNDVYLKDEIYTSDVFTFMKKWDGDINGITDTLTLGSDVFYKVDDTVIPVDAIDSITTFCKKLYTSSTNTPLFINTGCYSAGLRNAVDKKTYLYAIVVTNPGECKIKFDNKTYTFIAPSIGVYFYYASDDHRTTSLVIDYTVEQSKLYLNNNLNQFKVGIEADGALSTTDENGNVVRMITEQSDLTALTLKSPSGKRFKITVDDSGTISAAEITE